MSEHIILWNGKHLDGTLTITTESPAILPETNAPREVQFFMVSSSGDFSYSGSDEIIDTSDSLEELLNTITMEYVYAVQEMKNREIESGELVLQ